jgi:hypothetical protein
MFKPLRLGFCIKKSGLEVFELRTTKELFPLPPKITDWQFMSLEFFEQLFKIIRGLNSLDPFELRFLGGASKPEVVGVMLILFPLPEQVSYFKKLETLSLLSFLN